ncbi:Uncharacterised protein [uncultured archaeon]|nr:Uncharacterised protein [uncultured archaeon]
MSARIAFAKSWLFESPLNIGFAEHFEAILFDIDDWIDAGFKPISLGGGYFKIVGETKLYYFHRNLKNEIDISVELEKTPQNVTVRLLGKDPQYKGKLPYASDLYAKILDDNRTIRILSDDQLSEEGFKLWERLFNMGYFIGIYNRLSLSGHPWIEITSKEQMKKYFGTSPRQFFKTHQFVAANRKNFVECRSNFHTQRLYEKAGYDLSF